MFESQCFIEPVSLGYDLHKCFIAFFSHLDVTEGLEEDGIVEIPFSPVEYSSGKAFYPREIFTMDYALGIFHNGYSPFLFSRGVGGGREKRYFLAVRLENLLGFLGLKLMKSLRTPKTVVSRSFSLSS